MSYQRGIFLKPKAKFEVGLKSYPDGGKGGCLGMASVDEADFIMETADGSSHRPVVRNRKRFIISF